MWNADATLEALPDAVIGINREGVIELVNRATEHIFGYNREEIIGHPLAMLLPERMRERHEAHLKHYFAAPAVRGMGLDLILLGIGKDGVEFPVEINIAPLSDTGAIAVVRRVSERVQRALKFARERG